MGVAKPPGLLIFFHLELELVPKIRLASFFFFFKKI